ncbi:MAG: cation:proton antiporter [Actinomycetota bacterium]
MGTGTVFFSLFIIVIAAAAAGELMARLRQPAIIGELAVGILLGPSLLGLIKPSETLTSIAAIGAVVLMMLVGLETRIDDLKRIGGAASSVAILGVVLPLSFGFLYFYYLGFGLNESAFVGAALVATSVGITARVLSDMGVINEIAGRIILAAAVIDDILGLMVLAIVRGFSSGHGNPISLALLGAGMLAFLAIFMIFGTRAARKHSAWVEKLAAGEAPFIVALAVMLGFAAGADRFGLAAIIGSFLAGVFLGETIHSDELVKRMRPISHMLTPVFFVLMGTYVDASFLGKPHILSTIGILFMLAILGKIIAGALGTIRHGKRVMLQTGLGMVPRGEVGLIIGLMGLSMHVISPSVYTMIVAVSVLTTLVTPFFLKAAFRPRLSDAVGIQATEQPHSL